MEGNALPASRRYQWTSPLLDRPVRDCRGGAITRGRPARYLHLPTGPGDGFGLDRGVEFGIGFAGDRGFDLFAPGLQELVKFSGFAGIALGEVGGLADIVVELVELEVAGFEIFVQFPRALADDGAGAGAEQRVALFEVVFAAVALQVGGEMPEQRPLGKFAGGGLVAFEQGQQIDAVEWLVGGPFGAGEGAEGRVEIDADDRGVVAGSRCPCSL